MSGTDKKILSGKKILVTRASHQTSELSHILRSKGAKPVEFPVIEIRPMQSPGLLSFINRLSQDKYDYVIFTSRNGVDIFFNLAGPGNAREFLRKTDIVAVGSSTAKALRKRKVSPAVVPEKYVAEHVAEALIAKGIKNKKVLLLKPREARRILPKKLRSAGALVKVMSIYETLPVQSDSKTLKRTITNVDFITVTSSSTVKNLYKIYVRDRKKTVDASKLFGKARLVSIGPITSRTARKLGLKVDIEAKEYTIKGLVKAIAEYVKIDKKS